MNKLTEAAMYVQRRAATAADICRLFGEMALMGLQSKGYVSIDGGRLRITDAGRRMMADTLR